MSDPDQTVTSRRSDDLQPPHIVIFAMMGVGKSTVGRLLAAALGRPFVDSDDDIERLTGSTGREIAEHDGVPALHVLEAAVLLGALARSTPTVIAAAASTVESAPVRDALALRSRRVRLELDVDTTLARQSAGTHRRPMSADELTTLTERRRPLFLPLDDIVLDAGGPPEDLVVTIISRLSAAVTTP